MSRVDDIISSIGNNGTEKKKSRVESIIENSSNGNLKTGVDKNYINSFAKDTNDFLSNFNNDLKDIGFNNASSYYESLLKANPFALLLFAYNSIKFLAISLKFDFTFSFVFVHSLPPNWFSLGAASPPPIYFLILSN